MEVDVFLLHAAKLRHRVIYNEPPPFFHRRFAREERVQKVDGSLYGARLAGNTRVNMLGDYVEYLGRRHRQFGPSTERVDGGELFGLIDDLLNAAREKSVRDPVEDRVDDGLQTAFELVLSVSREVANLAFCNAREGVDVDVRYVDQLAGKLIGKLRNGILRIRDVFRLRCQT